jgi:hypothetical protein
VAPLQAAVGEAQREGFVVAAHAPAGAVVAQEDQGVLGKDAVPHALAAVLGALRRAAVARRRRTG